MVFSSYLIPLMLFAISLISVITFYLAYKTNNGKCFYKVLLFAIFYIFLNSFYSLIIEVCYPYAAWKDRLAPFVLMYGPLLYFGIVSLRDKKLAIWTVLLHSLPFIYFSVYLLGLLVGVIRSSSELLHQINQQLYLAGPLSFIVYTLMSFFVGRKVLAADLRDKLLMFVFGRVFLLFLAMTFLIITFSKTIGDNNQAVSLLRMMVYSCMLIFMLMIFNFAVNKLLNRFPQDRELDEVVTSANIEAKYERSTLAVEQLQEYQEKLDQAMQVEELFLDPTLSLTSLAHHLKAPNHHLTQVFSRQVRQTFYQYVNGFRIAYACSLLTPVNADMNLEELAEKSGFNSKASFNRQFKNIKGCTPSEYRNKIT